MGEMTPMSDGLPTALDVMRRAYEALVATDYEGAQAWIAFAAELRAGRRADMLDRPLRVTTAPVPMARPLRDADEPVVRDVFDESDVDTIYGYRRGQQRPPSLTAFRAAVKTRRALDAGEETALLGLLHVDRPAASSLVDEIISRAPAGWQDLGPDDELRTMDERPQRVIAGQRYVFGVDRSSPAAVDAAFVDPGTIRRIGERLRDMPAEDAPEPVAGEPETDDERVRRFASGAAGPRPFVGGSTGSFDAFGGRPRYEPQHIGDETTVLSGGDPSSCRHCGEQIYEPDPADVGTRHRYRHALTEQAVCSTPPRGLTPSGDETYVGSTHTFAEPGGLPYRRAQ